MSRIRRWLLPALALSAFVLAACGGGSDDGSNASAAPPESLRSASIQFVDLAQSAQTLEELTSFRFDLNLKLEFGGLDASSGDSEDPLGDAFAAALLGSLGDIQAEGTIVGPDEYSVVATFAGQEFGFVQIGDQAWSNSGDGWEAEAAGESGGFTFTPADLYDGFLPLEVLEAYNVGEEQVNGVTAVHYALDKDSILELAQTLGEDASEMDDLSVAEFDFWLTAEGVPVRFLVNVEGVGPAGETVKLQMEMNLYDLNNPDLEVEAPA